MRLAAPAVQVCLATIALLLTPAADGRLEHGRRIHPPTLLAAGDIGSCTSAAAATAALVAGLSGTVATLGDNAYPSGSPGDFARCYEPGWGEFRSRTRPSAGNHDYGTAGAAGYFGYFGTRAGDPNRGYYSYRLGTWNVIVLNSNCDEVGGCADGTPQERWLRATLRARGGLCTLAYWHHPRFSQGPHGDDARVGAFWRDLYADGVEIVLNGHDHAYERFAPQSPTGAVDRTYGIREFVVGTGGAGLYPFVTVEPASEARDNTTFGILRLVLGLRGYSWQFLPAAGGSFRDSGRTTCHRPARGK